MNTEPSQELPLGTSDFKALREANQIYVDKTPIIYGLASKRAKYFLARPRRFGKSLLISTFESLFQNGIKEFKNLEIEKLWRTEKSYQVIKLDFSTVSIFETAEIFKVKLRGLIDIYFKPLGFQHPFQDDTFYIALSVFLQRLDSNSLVLLIDEYDAPLTSCINNPELFENIRDELVDFYAAIKSGDNAFRFLFITGITKLGKLSLFSSLNNLVDLTLTERAATLLGYTKTELEKYFYWYIQNASHILNMNTDQLIEFMVVNYDGFRFSGETDAHVFAPWSVLNFLNMPESGFLPYWVASGGGLQLLRQYLKVDVLRDPNNFFKPKRVTKNSLRSSPSDIEHIDDLVLLTQTGYLTIKSVGTYTFDVGYPNREIADSLGVIYRERLWSDKQMDNLGSPKLSNTLQYGEIADFVETLNKFFLALDYKKFPIQDEFICRNYTQLILLDRPGIDVFSEFHNALGNSDLEIRTQYFYWVLELKFIGLEKENPGLIERKLNEAKKQLLEKQYGLSEISDRKLIRLGIVFSEKYRKFIAWGKIPTMK